MHTDIDEVMAGIYRLSTYIEEVDFTFNQYLIDADQPLLFHCGMRALFPVISAAVPQVMPLTRLRWVSFGHWEADESGAMNDWLEAASEAQVAVGTMGCMLSVNDLAVRPPKPLEDEESLDLGGKRVRYLATPHVPHGWDAGVLFEETSKTLFCGDLFTRNRALRGDLGRRSYRARSGGRGHLWSHCADPSHRPDHAPAGCPQAGDAGVDAWVRLSRGL